MAPLSWETGPQDKLINGEIGPGLPMRTAIYRSGTYEIELIEPTGPSVYMDFCGKKARAYTTSF